MLNRRNFIGWSILGSSYFMFSTACKKVVQGISDHPALNGSLAESLSVNNFYPQQGAYFPGYQVKVGAQIKNNSTTALTVTAIVITVKNISTTSNFSTDVSVAQGTTINANDVYDIADFILWTVPAVIVTGAYGIYLKMTLSDGSVYNQYQTFIRVADNTMMFNYTLNKTTYQQLPVYTLDGGLSAEYTVAKAAEVLSAGVAHSWYTTAPGSGPKPVYSTPMFLDLAVNNTVNFYNQQFGATTIFDTVIISTGVSSIPYLSRVMKAPVLPLHFLVSADTVKEIVSILSYANNNGYDAYSTLGYDGSITMSVAWIKLLQIPQQYINFLNQHQVKQVIFAGTYGNAGGEGTAKKILYNTSAGTGYNTGDIFLMYPGGGTSDDFTRLYDKIKDLHEYDNKLEANYRQISDWESGLVDEQLTHFVTGIRANTQNSVTHIRRLSATDSLEMYNLATYLTLSFIQKNQSIFTADGPAIRGVAMNPYLLAHPTYESKINYIPMLFWQGNSGTSTVSRLVNQIKQNILAYFPNTNFNGLNFWVNTALNFGGYQATALQSALQTQGLTNITMSDQTKEEVWNTADGMNAICENIATNILTYSSPTAYKAWDNSLTVLSIADLDALPTKHPDIHVVAL
jgi:hypothetical protein